MAGWDGLTEIVISVMALYLSPMKGGMDIGMVFVEFMNEREEMRVNLTGSFLRSCLDRLKAE